MSNTLNLGNGQWATKEGSLLAYNSENNNYKPLPFTFDRDTIATRVNKDGLIETVGADQPRIDYLNDSNGALKLEPQSTNLITYSEDFSDSSWTKLGSGTGTTAVVTSNYAISPDGTLNASRIVLDKGSGTTSGDFSAISDINSLTGDGTFSIYLKSNTGTNYVVSQRIEDDRQQITVTKEWQRFTFSSSSLVNGTSGLWLRGGYGSDDYADLLVYAAQTENLSYATSYIPTSGSAVTRLADSCNQTPPSGIIGQTEGTVFLDFNVNAIQDNGRIFAIGDGGTNNRVLVRFETNGYLAFASTGGVFQWSHTEATLSLGRHKMAIAYALNDVAFYVDGILVNSESTYSVPVTDKFYIGTSEYGGAENTNMKINNSKLYNTRLSNSELQALTT